MQPKSTRASARLQPPWKVNAPFLIPGGITDGVAPVSTHTQRATDQYRHKGCFAITACALSNFSSTKIPAATESAEQTWNERNKKQFPRLLKLRKAAGGSHTRALSLSLAHTRETGEESAEHISRAARCVFCRFAPRRRARTKSARRIRAREGVVNLN